MFLQPTEKTSQLRHVKFLNKYSYEVQQQFLDILSFWCVHRTQNKSRHLDRSLIKPVYNVTDIHAARHRIVQKKRKSTKMTNMGKEGEFQPRKETSFLTVIFCVCGLWFLFYHTACTQTIIPMKHKPLKPANCLRYLFVSNVCKYFLYLFLFSQNQCEVGVVDVNKDLWQTITSRNILIRLEMIPEYS